MRHGRNRTKTEPTDFEGKRCRNSWWTRAETPRSPRPCGRDISRSKRGATSDIRTRAGLRSSPAGAGGPHRRAVASLERSVAFFDHPGTTASADATPEHHRGKETDRPHDEEDQPDRS